MHRSILVTIALCAFISGCQKAADPGGISAGKVIYDQNCAVCHGPDGNVRLAQAHDAKTPDLRTIASRSAGHLPRVMLKKMIDGRDIVQAHRVRNMPVWGEQLNNGDGTPVETKIESLLDYIDSIQVK